MKLVQIKLRCNTTTKINPVRVELNVKGCLRRLQELNPTPKANIYFFCRSVLDSLLDLPAKFVLLMFKVGPEAQI